MATNLGSGSGAKQGGKHREPKPKQVILFGGQHAKKGSIIVTQHGSKFRPGKNVGMGKDFSIFAKKDGIVDFYFGKKGKKYIQIIEN